LQDILHVSYYSRGNQTDHHRSRVNVRGLDLCLKLARGSTHNDREVSTKLPNILTNLLHDFWVLFFFVI